VVGACGCGTIIGVAETRAEAVEAWRGRVSAAVGLVFGACTRKLFAGAGWAGLKLDSNDGGPCGQVASGPISHQVTLCSGPGPVNLFQ
jgi:hypothetical protein